MHLMKLLNFDCAKWGFSRREGGKKSQTRKDANYICDLQQLQYMYISVFREQWIILINPTSIVEKEILFNYI